MPLTEWWRPLAARGLFDWTAGSGPLLAVVADLNVLLDLFCPWRHGADQTQVLGSPACDNVELLVTDKALNELNALSSDDRVKQRAFVQRHRQVPVDVVEADRLHRELIDAADSLGTRDCTDDLRYVAEAASAGLSVFVTRDSEARKTISSIARDVADVEVLSPAELVLRAEELRDATAFRPALLLDTPLSARHARAGDEARLIGEFLMRSLSERKTTMTHATRSLLSAPHQWASMLVSDETAERLLAFFVSGPVDDLLDVPMFRLAPGRIALTLARQLAFGLRERARELGARAVRVTDGFCSELVVRGQVHLSARVHDDV